MEAEYLNMQLVSVDRIFDALPPNTCIKTLNLHYNLLQDLKGLKNMHSYVKNITEINISSNRLNNSSNLNDLTYLFDLKILDLSGNYYTSLDALPYLPSLETLHVAYNPIKTLENIHRNCPNITKLDIRNIFLPSYYDETILIKPLNELKSLHTLLITGSGTNAAKVNMPGIVMNIIAKCKHIQNIDNISCVEWMENNKPMTLPSTSPIPILPPRSPTIIENNQLIDDEKENILVSETPAVIVVNTPRFDQIAQRFRSKQTHKEVNSSIIYSRHNDHDDYGLELDETMKADSGSEKSIEEPANNSCFNIDNSHDDDENHEQDFEEEVTASNESIQLVTTEVQTISFDHSLSSNESNEVRSPLVAKEYIDEATSPLILSVVDNEDQDEASSLLVSIDNNPSVSAAVDHVIEEPPVIQQADNNPCVIAAVEHVIDEPLVMQQVEVENQASQTEDALEAQQRLFQRQLRLQNLLHKRQMVENRTISAAFHTLRWNIIIHQVNANHKKSQEIIQSKSLQDRREAIESVSRRLINQESLNMTLRKDIDKITSKYEEIMSKNTGLEAQVTSQLDTIQGLETRLHEATIANTTVNTQLSTANTNVISLNKLCNDTMQENSRLQNEVEEVKSKYNKLEKRFYATETCFNEATEQLTVANHNNKALMSKFQELTECTKKLQLTLRHYKQLHETANHTPHPNATSTDVTVDTSEISKRLDSLETVLVQKTKELIESQQKEKDLHLVIKVKEKMLEDQLAVISTSKEQIRKKNNEIEQLLQSINTLQETVDALNDDINSYETELNSKNKIIKELRALVHALQQSNQVTTSMSMDEWTYGRVSIDGTVNEEDDYDYVDEDGDGDGGS